MRGFVHLFQRVFQLAVGDFQLGQFQNQRVAALQQRIQQLALSAQLSVENAVLFAGQRLAIGLMLLTDLRLFVEKIFITQTLDAQLRHFRVQLLRLRHLRQTRDLSA
ncbi:hypothetical protein D3C81_1580840 [compost metagenome]